MKAIDWNQMSELGLIERINREICHPLGLAVSRNPETGTSDFVFVSDDGEWQYADSLGSSTCSDDEVKARLKLMELTEL